MIHSAENVERLLLWRCFTAVCGANADNAPLNWSRKEADRPLCLKATWNSAAYEASLRQEGGADAYLEGGALICRASHHKSQVAEPLDHCTMRTTWTVSEGKCGSRDGIKWGCVVSGNSFSDTVNLICNPLTGSMGPGRADVLLCALLQTGFPETL